MASFEDAYQGNNHTSALTDLLFTALARSPDLLPFGELLEPLAARDQLKRTDLVRTLRIYLDEGANATKAADRLFLHRNSMLYRLARIEELTGLDLKDHRVALALQLGLLANERGERRATQHP